MNIEEKRINFKAIKGSLTKSGSTLKRTLPISGTLEQWQKGRSKPLGPLPSRKGALVRKAR